MYRDFLHFFKLEKYRFDLNIILTYIIIEIVIVVSRMNNDSARLILKTTQIFKNKNVLTFFPFFLDFRQTVFIGTKAISSESTFKEGVPNSQRCH